MVLAHPAPVPALSQPQRAVLSTTLAQTTFVSAPAAGTQGPDDLVRLGIPGLNPGRGVVWTAYQNGVNPNGTAGSPGGPTWSTIVGYDPVTGGIVRRVNVTGKVDGLGADPRAGTLRATVNGDDHSALNVLYPQTGAVVIFQYTPNPAISGNGGTDSVAVRAGTIYVAHSNPNDTTQATDYEVTLDTARRTAQLTPVFYDDSPAWTLVTHATVRPALTDPDPNFVVPAPSPGHVGDLATIRHGDGEIVFASHLNHDPPLQLLRSTDNVSGNGPPIDGLAVATCGSSTLYVVEANGNAIYALDTTGSSSGTVFVGQPSDTGNPLVGTLDLTTGPITPIGNHFAGPTGLLFVPNPSYGCGAGQPGHGDVGQGDQGRDGPGDGARSDDGHGDE